MMKFLLSALCLFCFANLAAHGESLTWRQLKTWNPGVTGPGAREHAIIWIDPAFPQTLNLFGGLTYDEPQKSNRDFWRFDLQQEVWRKRNVSTIAPTGTGRFVVDAATQQLIYQGGITADDQNNIDDIFVGHVDKDSLNWTHVASKASKSHMASLHSLFYDITTKLFVTACGVLPDGLCTVSAFSLDSNKTKAVWQDLNATAQNGVPQERYGFSYAFDAQHSRLVLASGQLAPHLIDGKWVYDEQSNETWFLNVSHPGGKLQVSWSKLDAPALPERRNPCWAHDTKRNHLYVWGGTHDQVSSIPGLYRLDLNNEALGWQLVPAAGTESVRSSCVGVYDAVGDRLIFGLGNTSEAYATDLWEVKIK